MANTFKHEHKFEKRVELCNRLKTQYSDRIPIIVEAAERSQLELTRKKYLAPMDISVGAFLNEIRKQAKIKPEEAIFLFFGNGVLAPTAFTIAQAYDKYKDEDGFLYISVALENTFGADLFYTFVTPVLNASSKLISFFKF